MEFLKRGAIVFSGTHPRAKEKIRKKCCLLSRWKKILVFSDVTLGGNSNNYS
jgi:hypothetical protein